MAERSADGERATRPYHSPLRERQTAETRRLILEALAHVIAEQGTSDFTVEDVAEQAGVATRTVYRRFPNRQALLDGLTEHIDEQLAAAGLPNLRDTDKPLQLLEDFEDAEQLMFTIPEVMRQFDEFEPFSTAMVLTAHRGGLRSERHERRTQVFRELFADELERIDPDEREAVFAVIRHLVSAQTWYVLRNEFGLDGETAGRAVARVIRTILSADARR